MNSPIYIALKTTIDTPALSFSLHGKQSVNTCGAEHSGEWDSWRAVDCYVNERIITERWQLWSLGKGLNQTKLCYSHLHLPCSSPSHTPSILWKGTKSVNCRPWGTRQGEENKTKRKVVGAWEEGKKRICLLATLISPNHIAVSGGKESLDPTVVSSPSHKSPPKSILKHFPIQY